MIHKSESESKHTRNVGRVKVKSKKRREKKVEQNCTTSGKATEKRKV